MTKSSGMRPQDIVVLLGVLAMGPRPWRQNDLAQKVCLSPAEITQSLERSRRAGLIGDEKRGVRRRALMEFIEHGLRYVYPAAPGAIVRGIPTAHSAPPLASPHLGGGGGTGYGTSPFGDAGGGGGTGGGGGSGGGGGGAGGPVRILSHSSDVYVWPDDDGYARGQAIVPLYPTVPKAAKADPHLYEMLVLVEAIRVGRARERQHAVALLGKIMQGEGAENAEQS